MPYNVRVLEGREYYVDQHGRERMRIPHYVSPEHKAQAEKNLNALLNEYFTDKSHMNRELQVSRNTVSWWFKRKMIGKTTAKKIGADPNYRFSAWDLRPDCHEKPVEDSLLS